jgi:AraC family transcriptional regulator of adaptative response/methylated-DNA-[protein]-cysteine methyltransferase
MSLFWLLARNSVDRSLPLYFIAPMSRLTYDRMVEAMRSNDARYNGRFYVGVHSTGIYCLPSCKAKLPKLSNVVFYGSREEAIAAGLRGCRRCRSESFPDILPDWLHRLLREMKNNPDLRLTEQDLIRVTGVDVSTVRRYFREHLKTTPLAFHRRIRLEHARHLIEAGVSYIQAGFECGYESPSGFRSAFKQAFGKTPGEYHVKK